MHPFCCVSTVSEHTTTPPFSMSAAAPAQSARSDPAIRSSNCSQNHQNHTDPLRLSQRSTASSATDITASGPIVARQPSVRESQPGDVKLNDIVLNGISGVLYKWVNYGKGWRPRWFVLQDGVLSYYKIHGTDKIVLNQETVKGSKVIGEESIRRISRQSNGHSQHRRKPVGEIHLKVSSIRESRSDDKRFSIFTGMKRLHLRAETREDRVMWMEALQAVKDMFPRISNSELMAPIDNIAASTEKLRQRLEQEGLREQAIQDSEQIMRTEFAALQQQLFHHKQKQLVLIDTLRQLEVHVMKIRKQKAPQKSSVSATSLQDSAHLMSFNFAT